jgi:uncharacterized protein YdaU (DUF1376 family)
MPRDKTGHFYYSWYPTVFRADTQKLGPFEDGVYRRLIDEYMLTRSPLENDDRGLARIAGITSEEWAKVKTQVVSYFKAEGLFLHHTFCDEMLSADSNRIRTSRTNGKNGGRPSYSKTSLTTHSVTGGETRANPVGSPRTELNRTKQEKKPPSEPKKTRKEYSAEFDQFWNSYPGPRREEKPAAFHEWQDAISKTPPQEIIAAVQRYCLTSQVVEGFAPRPAKWLKMERFNEQFVEHRTPNILKL